MSFASSRKATPFKTAKGKPYLFMFIFLAVIIGVSSFLLEGIAFFNTPFSSLMTDLEFYVTFAVCGLCFIGFFFMSIRFFKVKPSAFWLVFFLALFAGNLVAIYLFPAEVSGTTVPISNPSFDWTYTLEEHFRIRYVLAFGAGCIDLYILFAVAPKVLRSSRAIIWIHYAFAIVVVIAIIWSFATEGEVYAYYFNPEAELDEYMVVSSFFLNRNTYAAVLFVGMAAIGVIQADSHHFWNYILMGFFYIQLFFTVSKTGIIIGTGFLFAYVLYRFIVNLRFHKGRAFLGLILFLLAVGALLAICELQLLPRNIIIVKLYTNFKQAFFDRVESGFLDYRVEIWNNCNAFLETNGLYTVFGVGEINALTLLRAMWQTDAQFYYTHNGFVHQLFAGGWLRLSLYILLLGYIFYVVVVNCTHRRRITVPCLLGILALIGQGITETTFLLGTETKAFLYVLMFVVPMFTDFRQDRHPEIKEGQQTAYLDIGTKYKYVVSPHNKTLICLGVLLPFLFFFMGVVPLMAKLDTMWYHQFDYQPLFFTCMVVLILSPIVFYAGFHDAGIKGRFIVSFNFVFSFSAVAAVILSPKLITFVFAAVALAVWVGFILAANANFFSLQSLKGLLKVYGSLAFVSLIFLGLNHFFAFVRPELIDESSPTLNIVLLIAEVVGYFVVVYALLPFHGFGYPIGHLLYRFDRRICRCLDKWEEKVELREEIYSGDYVGKYYKNGKTPQ